MQYHVPQLPDKEPLVCELPDVALWLLAMLQNEEVQLDKEKVYAFKYALITCMERIEEAIGQGSLW